MLVQSRERLQDDADRSFCAVATVHQLVNDVDDVAVATQRVACRMIRLRALAAKDFADVLPEYIRKRFASCDDAPGHESKQAIRTRIATKGRFQKKILKSQHLLVN
jgi:hypothetical protein